jgi:hypothetical protein
VIGRNGSGKVWVVTPEGSSCFPNPAVIHSNLGAIVEVQKPHVNCSFLEVERGFRCSIWWQLHDFLCGQLEIGWSRTKNEFNIVGVNLEFKE